MALLPKPPELYTVNNILYLGQAAGGVGSYALGGGSLAVEGELIGAVGTGNFSQTGGTHTVGSLGTQGLLDIGDANLGSFALTDPSAILNVYGNELIGDSATGTKNPATHVITQYGGNFTQSGGTFTISNALVLGNVTNSTGSYTLSGGSLAVDTGGQATGYEYIGAQGTGLFTQSGGTLAMRRARWIKTSIWDTAAPAPEPIP